MPATFIEKLKSIFPTEDEQPKPTQGSSEARTIYVNMEIPIESLDAYGQPTAWYTSNHINTAKYTWYTFLPKNLFEQFRGIANLYFLFLVIIQMFPLFSTSASPVLVVLPLAAILVLTGAKDAIEDNKRRKTDESVNKARTYTLSDWKNVNVPVYETARWKKWFSKKEKSSATPPLLRFKRRKLDSTDEKTRMVDPRWKPTLWEDVKVGDFVYLQNDDAVPADILILSSSEQDGLCYVETQNLDGETNLKIMRSLQATNEIATPEHCDSARFYIESEAPHANLYTVNGALKWKAEQNRLVRTLTTRRREQSKDTTSDDNTIVSHEKTEAITASSVLLRGCVLRNTSWVIGLVMFTGNDTKIMLNSGKTPSKRSKMEKATNPYVIVNFVLLLAMCLICAIASSIVYNSDSSADYFESADAESGTMEGFIIFWVSLVIYQNIIPISLYISVQIVKTTAAYFIHADVDMYNERLNQPCIPKTWNISDDLGQIEYIFSDKTGTLTQNIMEFRRCTINGVCYGLGETEAAVGAKLRDGNHDSSFFSSPDISKAREAMLEKQRTLFNHQYVNPNSTFVDPQLIDDISAQDEQSQSIVHFFSALALCHTVIPEIPDESLPHFIQYKAQSPDEAALVSTARDMGFTFLGREQENIIVDIMGEQRVMELLHVLEFNSTRKRMSVIMRSPQDGKIILLCKGADSVIYERLSTGLETKVDEESRAQLKMRQDTLDHLGVFANEGLRTLCIASRMVEEDEYQQWAERYQNATNSIVNRDEQIEQVCEEIENSLTLIGGTAIEDKLQEGVPDTIAVLAEAGIKIWVLTGDKVETAINIGFACNLLTNDMLLINVSAKDEEETMDQLKKSIEQVEEKSKTQKCALVIDGESLKYALEPGCKDVLLELGTQCRAVVCCRVSPMQKAKVVNLVKKGLKVMTLAIGDGANDVSMIQEANVGIGISGEEGRQAVMASDYAIAQFRYLSKLLLVHGRWSYLRTSEMILTFFYKNIMWTFVLFWYQLVCGFTGTMMFDYSYITLYNLVFTSLPCIFAGVFDQDLKASYSFRFPQLYLMGIRNDKFTRTRFFLTVFDAIYQSAICFGIPYLLFVGPKISSSGYDVEGVIELGTFIAGIAVVVANVLVGFTIYSWTWITILCIILSCATFFIWTGIYSAVMTFTFYGESILFGQGVFWLCLLLTCAICLLPRFTAKYYIQSYHPFDNDIIRESVLCKPSTLERMKTKNKYGVDEEEAIPITSVELEQTQSLYQEESLIKKRKKRGFFSLGRKDSTRSEIMNMKTGKRMSFTGFAYSSDDNNAFGDFRKSIYRTNTNTSKISQTSLSRFSKSRLSDLKETSKDWMPLDGFKLRSYHTTPVGDTTREHGSFGKKMIQAVKSRMTSKSSTTEE